MSQPGGVGHAAVAGAVDDLQLRDGLREHEGYVLRISRLTVDRLDFDLDATVSAVVAELAHARVRAVRSKEV